ncbi:Cft2 family RNA processing exonuclease [Bradyrhizobium japonicum]
MLPDAGNIQETEVAALNRRNAARGRGAVTAIYTQADAIATLDAFRPVEYQAWYAVIPGVRARYWNAGHLLGSASIELEFAEQGRNGGPLRVLMSGDIGPDAKLLEPDPEAPTSLDYVFCESTYGDSDRPSTTHALRRAHLAQEVRDAASGRGALLIPAFAVERTQELIVDLADLMARGEIPTAPIFLDSPLAIRATEVFRNNTASLDPSVDLDRLLTSSQLHFTETVDESKSIARLSGFHIIIAASGMCDAGRIRHHLKRWLWRRECTVLLAGFQAQGTLGRFLRDGAKAVRNTGRRDQSRCEDSIYRRILRARRRSGTRALDCRAATHSSRSVHRAWGGARARRPSAPGRRANRSDRADFHAYAGRRLRIIDSRADTDRRCSPPQARSRCSRQPRLAQRYVQTASRYQ